MKKLLQFIIIIILLALFFKQEASAQTPLDTATQGIVLQCSGGTDNRAGIAYNPNQQFYYSANAGSGSYPMETFSVTGTALASIASGYSYRGIWWNPTNNSLEGKVYNTAGIVQQNLDGNYYPLGTGTTIVSGSGPDAQSCGDYDWVDDEVLYYYNGSIYRYDRATHTLINSVAITGLPSGATTTNLNSNTAAYTNIAGMEAGVYDHVNKAFYFINKTTGAYVAKSQLPMTAPAAASFQMGFENNRLWLYNTTTSQWEAYLVISCNTDSTLVVDACYSYTSPSGNYTWTSDGTYMDTIPNQAGCDSILTINLSITTIDTTVTQNGYSLSANDSTASYQWLDCNNSFAIIQGETQQNFSPNIDGTYAVELTKNNCVDTTTCFIISGIGIDETDNKPSIYPNPSNGKFIVTIKEHSSVSIINTLGAIVYQGVFNSGTHSFDVSYLYSGVYFMNVRSQDKTHRFTIVIQ